MERRMSTATKQIDSCCWSPPTKEGEHSSSWNDFVWLPPLLKFVVDIILSSAFPLLPNWQSHEKFLCWVKKIIFPEKLELFSRCVAFFLSVSYPTRTKNKIVTRSSYYASKQFSAISSFTSTVVLLLWPANLYWLSRIMTNERWPSRTYLQFVCF